MERLPCGGNERSGDRVSGALGRSMPPAKQRPDCTQSIDVCREFRARALPTFVKEPRTVGGGRRERRPPSRRRKTRVPADVSGRMPRRADGTSLRCGARVRALIAVSAPTSRCREVPRAGARPAARRLEVTRGRWEMPGPRLDRQLHPKHGSRSEGRARDDPRTEPRRSDRRPRSPPVAIPPGSNARGVGRANSSDPACRSPHPRRTRARPSITAARSR